MLAYAERPVSTWTEERTALLEEMWRAGKTGSQIVEALGGNVTRNAVIGKAHRLGLNQHADARATTPRRKKQNAANNRIRRITMAAHSPTTQNAIKAAGGRSAWIAKHLQAEPDMGPKPLPPQRSEVVGRKGILDLEETDCRYPVGDRAPYLFCGEPKVEGQPYCARCCQISFTTPKPASQAPVVNYVRRIPTFA